MSKREVYKEIFGKAREPKSLDLKMLDPYIEAPKMKVSEVNRLNELIKRDRSLPIVKDGYDEWGRNEEKYACPTCGCRVYEDYDFCPYCGQRLDTYNFAL